MLMMLADAGIFRLLCVFFRMFSLAVRQTGILNATHPAVRIDITLCTKGHTGAMLLYDNFYFRFLAGFAAILRIADFTHKRARYFFGIAANLIMLMAAIQLLSYASTFLTTYMDAILRFHTFGVRGSNAVIRHFIPIIWITFFCMDMYAVFCKLAATIAMLMGAGQSLGITTACRMLLVVFTQPDFSFRSMHNTPRREHIEYHRCRQEDSHSPVHHFPFQPSSI